MKKNVIYGLIISVLLISTGCSTTEQISSHVISNLEPEDINTGIVEIDKDKMNECLRVTEGDIEKTCLILEGYDCSNCKEYFEKTE